MSLSAKAILEQVELSDRAQRLARGTATDRAEAAVLVQRAKMIGERGISSDEARGLYSEALNAALNPPINEERYRKAFFKYLNSRTTDGEAELRDLLAGSQSITYSSGAAGGFLIPLTHESTVFEALSEVDNLLSPDVCGFVKEPTATLQPKQIWGYDLSTITASLVGESTLQSTSNFPPIGGRVLRGNIIYKVSIGASIESEDDVPGLLDKFSRAFGVAFARKLGADAINGNGSATQPQGLLTALPTPIYTTGSGKITLTDINSIYFSVNRVYRSQPKCGWLCSDSVYQRIRAAVDNSGRPLLQVDQDTETLLGKPIHISPTLGLVGGSPAQNSSLFFGDLSQFHIRCSRPTVQRVVNGSVADITSGRAEYIARIRMDSALFDPSGGTAAPIANATVAA